MSSVIKEQAGQTEVQKLLETLLEKIEREDFQELVIKRGSRHNQISRQEYQVCVIDRLLKIVKENKWGLARNGDFIYIYNGEYWMLVDKNEFQEFLAKVAWKMAVPWIEAKQYLFQEQLLKQFYVSARLPSLNRDPGTVLINLKNGTYEVTTEGCRLIPFNRDHFLTYQLPFAHDPEATAPTFQEYLNRVLPEPGLQDVLAEFIGFVFVRKKLEKCLLCYGSGANGKSVFFEIISALLGDANVSHFSLSNLSEEHNRALIANKLLNYGSEIRANIETDIFKQLTSGEPVQCRLKYGNSFEIKDYARLMFNCNDLPAQVEHNEAFFRRFLIVPFKVMIPEIERDPDLSKKIIETELSGIFNWVLEGVERLIINSDFTRSEAVEESLKDYKKQSDNVHLFLTEGCYEECEKPRALKYIYDDYRIFCRDCGYSPLNIRNFRRRLDALGYHSVRRSEGTCYFLRPALPPIKIETK